MARQAEILPTIPTAARGSPAPAAATVALGLVLALVVPGSKVLGAPLPPETCDVLRGELALLEGGGAGANLERGVDWGKAHLSPEQLRYVARLIALREQVNFRCRPALIEQPTPPLPPPAPPAVTADTMPLPQRRQTVDRGAAAPANAAASRGPAAAAGAATARQ